MTKELLLTGERHIALAEYTETPIAPDEVHARGILSAISHGTELSLYRGTSPFGAKRFDTQLRLFLPAEPGSAYPQRLGYEWVGEVTEVGAQVTGYQPGMRVHLPLPHRETQTFKPAALAQLEVGGPLPEALSPERAVFLSSTSIALQAVHDARLKVGDRVVVFGLGVLGLLAVQLARRNGAALIAAVLGVGVFALAAVDSPWLGNRTVFALLFLVLSLAHTGVRIGRKTYLVDLASAENRAAYVAVSNSLIGVLLLAGAAIGLIAERFGTAAVIALLALAALGSAVSASRLPELE